jgi:hypothetical protein
MLEQRSSPFDSDPEAGGREARPQHCLVTRYDGQPQPSFDVINKADSRQPGATDDYRLAPRIEHLVEQTNDGVRSFCRWLLNARIAKTTADQNIESPVLQE